MLARSEKPRLLLIGIDGADYRITRRLMRQGCLPTLAELTRRGAWGPMRSTVPPVTPPAWTTIMTGKNPGKHGIFEFLAMNEHERDLPVATRRRATTIFRALSDMGYRVGTFNLPVTYPPEPLSGFQVAGFTAPAFTEAIACPTAAFELLRDASSDFALLLDLTERGERERTELKQRAELVTYGTRLLLREFPCDVYMTNFQVVDWAQHHALAAEMRPDRPETLDLDGLVADTYRIVDEQIGAIIDEWAAPETYVMVVSDHGGALVDRVVNFEKLFLEAGLLAYRPVEPEKAATVERGRARARAALHLWNGFKRAMPTFARLTRRLGRRLHPYVSSYQKNLTVDWSRTRAAPWGLYGQVRLNVAGRDPEGIVSPEQVPVLKAEIRELLLSVTDPVTGRPVFREVLDGPRLYTGPYAGEGPDLVALSVEQRYLTVCGRMLEGDALPLIDVQEQVVAVVDARCDFHSYDAIFLVAGPGIEAGKSLDEHRLEDFAPTALYLLGEGVPADMDGQPVLEAVSAELRQERPVKLTEPWPAPAGGGDAAVEAAYTQEEQKRVEERLRRLGYL